MLGRQLMQGRQRQFGSIARTAFPKEKGCKMDVQDLKDQVVKLIDRLSRDLSGPEYRELLEELQTDLEAREMGLDADEEREAETV